MGAVCVRHNPVSILGRGDRVLKLMDRFSSWGMVEMYSIKLSGEM
jgi:hypothetical protein